MSELQYLIALLHLQRWRLAAARDQGGYTLLELVIIAAGFAALTLAVVAIISAKVLSKAESIPTE